MKEPRSIWWYRGYALMEWCWFGTAAGSTAFYGLGWAWSRRERG